MGREEPTEPEEMLELARSYALKLRFVESKHWYRTYLCHRRASLDVQSEMHQLQQTEIDFKAACNIARLAGETSAAFSLDAPELREELSLLSNLMTSGPAEEAIHSAQRCIGKLGQAIREQWNLDENEEVWEAAAYCAAEDGNYFLACQLAERSPLSKRLTDLYQLLCQADIRLNHLSDEDWRRAKTLRQAMKKRDVRLLMQCLSDFQQGDDRDGGGSPGAGVPTRPRPPRLPAGEERGWPHSPPPS